MRRFPWAFSCLVLATAVPVSAQQFTYNAVTPNLPAQNIFTDGVELVDVDADDDLDIVFSNRGGAGAGAYGTGSPAAQHLFLNDGSGMFTAAHAQLNVANMAAPMVIAEDFDLDGDPDLMYARDSVWPNPTAPPVILINDGTGNFTNETAARIPAGFFMTGFGIAAGDTDNDGDLDVVVTNGGNFNGVATQARLLQNDGTGVFTNITATNMPVDTYNAQDVTLLDVDNDLDIDILLSGKGALAKRSRLYLNNGAGVFSINNSMNELGGNLTYEIDYADLDGDTDFDAFIQSNNMLQEGWAQNTGTAGLWPEVNIAGPNQDDNEIACLDFDNDGDLDGIVGSLGGSERAYTNNGAASFLLTAGVFQAVGDSTMDMAFGDLNGDDKYDFVTAQGEANNLDKVYINNGPADTLPPVFKVVETPAAIGASETVFRARVQDAISDDGHVNATLSYSWVTTGAGASSGSGDARPQGGGQWRAAVPTNPGTLSVSLTWTATDAAGNSANNGPIVVGAADPWTDLGGGLAGVSGIPVLVGSGPLTTGSAGGLALSSAAPSAICALFISLASTPAPFACGTLIPIPIVFQLNLFTNGAGNLNLNWPSWPAGLSGASVYFQYAIADGAAVCGVSISNGVRGDVP